MNRITGDGADKSADRNAHKTLQAKKYDRLIAMLVDRLGEDETAALWLDAERRLDAFLTTTTELAPGERRHTDNTIYPMCALYLAIAKRCGRDEAFEIVSTFMRTVALEAGGKLQRLVAPRPMRRLFMRAFGIMGAKMFGNEAGFEQRMHEVSSSHLRMDILACPYARHCAAAGAPELAKLFCANDEYAYGNLPGIEFRREGTIARGADRCDFELTLRDE